MNRTLGGSFVGVGCKLSLFILITIFCTTLLIANVQCTSWESITSPTTDNLQSVFMVSTNEGWAVGSGNSIFRWNGTTWNIVPKPGIGTTYYSVFMVNSNDGWAVGTFGATIRWNGANWNTISPTTDFSLYSVFMVNADDGWAVGDGGTILRWNGANWNIEPKITTADLRSVFMVNADDGWAVGDGGTILRWNGANWNIEPKTTTRYLESVFMINANNGYAVGHNTILQWNGANWNTITRPNVEILFSVFMVDSNDGWAVGWGGTIYRLDDSGWYPFEPKTTTIALNSVFLASASEGWAVGDEGTILRLTDGETLHATFTSSPENPEAGETISFDASGSYDSDGTIVNYDWNFGDNSFGLGMTSTTHSYEQNGTYMVTLTVTDNDGFTDTATTNIVVGSSAQDVTAPWGTLEINNGEVKTNSLSVTLNLEATDLESGVTEMRFRNEDSTWTNWEDYATTKVWILTSGDGIKKVFVQFKNGASLVSEYFSSINLDTSDAPAQEPFIFDLEVIVALIGVIVGIGTISGYIWRLKNRKTPEILCNSIIEKVNKTYNKFREDPSVLTEKLEKLEEDARKLLGDKKIFDSHYYRIKNLIDEYLA